MLCSHALDLDLSEAFVDLLAWQRVVGRQVEESFFLICQLAELVAVGHVHAAYVRLGLVHREVDRFADEAQEVGRQTEFRVVVKDVALDVDDR
ncbi:MAG: hypothetical protein M3306_09595 [Actinomycetota bacterium]|nr:hypothetical protein [Actinomycetota bacterium]